ELVARCADAEGAHPDAHGDQRLQGVVGMLLLDERHGVALRGGRRRLDAVLDGRPVGGHVGDDGLGRQVDGRRRGRRRGRRLVLGLLVLGGGRRRPRSGRGRGVAGGRAGRGGGGGGRRPRGGRSGRRRGGRGGVRRGGGGRRRRAGRRRSVGVDHVDGAPHPGGVVLRAAAVVLAVVEVHAGLVEVAGGVGRVGARVEVAGAGLAP